MTIAICDDEKPICEQVEKLVKKQMPDCNTELFASGEALLKETNVFDIIFLDIQMDDINGIQAARMLRNKKEEALLIFITGLKEYVFEAFDVSAFHYLLKPIEEKKFAEVFAKAVSEAEKKRGLTEEPFFMKSNGKTIILNRNHILYVESQNRMVNFHTTNECLELYSDMRDLEQQLGRNFYRCHRGYIVNMGHIAEYEKDRISLTIGLSRRKYKEFVKVYMDYLKKGGALLGSF